MQRKVCKSCNENKLLNDFYSANKKRSNGEEYVYYHPECKECAKRRTVKWQNDNPERRKEVKNKWDKKPENKKAKREIMHKFREQGKFQKWLENNRDKIKVYREKRMAHKNHKITSEEWENCKNYFNYRCAYCGLPIEEHYNRLRSELVWTDFHKEHVDHEGENDLSNCVPSCKFCNSSKHDAKFEEWYTVDNETFDKERLKTIRKWLFYDYKKYIGVN